MNVEVKAPGKLYLAGEYAVVTPGYSSLIMAVDRYLTASLTESNEGYLWSHQQADLHLNWWREEEKIVFDKLHPYDLVVAAMQVTENYLGALGVTLPLYNLQLTSDLDDANSQIKYGLGSSAAVTVAVVKALLILSGQSFDALLLYKLSSLVQIKNNTTGSLGDLAAAAFGGMIAYTSPSRSWILEQWKKRETAGLSEGQILVELIKLDWVDLSINTVNWTSKLSLVVGWTGHAASTTNLVKKMQDKAVDRDKVQTQFLIDSQQCVNQIKKGFEQEDIVAIQYGIRKNRKLLQAYSQDMGLYIETPALAQLCQLAEENGAAAKTSGAGGGDCGIALADCKVNIKQLEESWNNVGIKRLYLNLAPNYKDFN